MNRIDFRVQCLRGTPFVHNLQNSWFWACAIKVDLLDAACWIYHQHLLCAVMAELVDAQR